jgi:hypothetical protein
MFAAMAEIAKLSSCARKPGSSEVARARTRAHRQGRGDRALHRFPRGAQPAQLGGEAGRTVHDGLQQRRPALEQRCGGELDLAHRTGRRAEDRCGRGPVEDRLEPHDLVDQPDERARGGRQPGGPVGRPEEQVPQRGHRGGRLCRELLGRRQQLRREVAEHAFDLGAQTPGQQRAGPHGRESQRVADRRGPQQPDRHHRNSPCHQPAEQPVGQ